MQKLTQEGSPRAGGGGPQERKQARTQAGGEACEDPIGGNGQSRGHQRVECPCRIALLRLPNLFTRSSGVYIRGGTVSAAAKDTLAKTREPSGPASLTGALELVSEAIPDAATFGHGVVEWTMGGVGPEFSRWGVEPSVTRWRSAPASGASAPLLNRMRVLLMVALLWLGFGNGCGVRAQVPPDEVWRTLETEHFRVTFPERLEELGREAAARAEATYSLLSESFLGLEDGRTEVLLTDHVDFSNGSASVAPYRRVTIFVPPPVDGSSLSFHEGWLQLVLTHELAHTFHLDRKGPLAALLRRVFGNVPVTWPFFPERSVPGWTVEGLATWYESALGHAGRVAGTHHEMALRTAVLEDRFEGVDVASGDSPVWPAGDRRYVYGSLFFDYLVRSYGPEKIADFVETVSEQIVPYRLDAAARRSFGVSFSDAWADWVVDVSQGVAEAREQLRLAAPITEPARLTHGARRALHPRVDPTGEVLVFARSDGRSDAQLRRAYLDGSAQSELTRTNGTAAFSWLPDGSVLFAQHGADGPYRIVKDLHVSDRNGSVRRVTHGARLDYPSAVPGGRHAVAIQHGAGTTRLVEVDLTSGDVDALVPFQPDVHWTFPAVSPDGRVVAASRWSSGGLYDIVLLDRDGRLVQEVTRDRALDMAPTWSADGRWLLWSSDRSGILNVMAIRYDPESGTLGDALQVTNLLTGALSPSVDPRGRWIYFSGYHSDGWEVERVPFDPTTWFEPFPIDRRFEVDIDTDSPAPRDSSELADYSSAHTFVPRYWEPEVREPIARAGRQIIGRAFGLSTEAQDLVGRHTLDAYAVYSVGGGEVEGAARYAFAGFGNPVLGLAASQFWDATPPLMAMSEDGTEARLWVTERERSFSASITHRFPGLRTAASLQASGGMVWERRRLLDDHLEESRDFELTRTASRLSDLSATFRMSTARSHAFSIGVERGLRLALQARTRSDLDLPDPLTGSLGDDRSFDELTARLRAYRSLPGPGFANHVLAVQVSGGVARGPGADAFHYHVGGNAGSTEPITGFGLVGGSSYFYPVRGYPNGDRSGRYAWAIALEYRFPLALVNDAFGLFPLHVDRLAGSVFFDAGNAWGPETTAGARFDNSRVDALASVGVELVSDLLSLFTIPVTLRTGMAFPLLADHGAEFYLRFGRAF